MKTSMFLGFWKHTHTERTFSKHGLLLIKDCPLYADCDEVNIKPGNHTNHEDTYQCATFSVFSEPCYKIQCNKVNKSSSFNLCIYS